MRRGNRRSNRRLSSACGSYDNLQAHGRWLRQKFSRLRCKAIDSSGSRRSFLACLLLRAELALTKAEQEQIAGHESQLFPQERGIGATQRNTASAARAATFHVHENMRIPENSRIYHAFQEVTRGGGLTELPCFENLQLWQHSDGRGLAAREVAVYTRPQGQALLVLVIAALE